MTDEARRIGPVEAVLARVAGRLGIGVGQAYTLGTGLVVAVLLAALGLPPVLRGVDGSAAVALAPPAGSDAAGDDAASPVPAAAAAVLTGAPGAVVVPFRPAGSPGSTGARPAPVPVAPAPLPLPAPVPAPPVDGGAARVLAELDEDAVPAGIAVGPDGTVYVAVDVPGTASTILALQPDGAPLGSWAVTGQPAERDLGLTGLAVDDAGAVWALDASTSRVLRLDPASSTISVVATIPDVAPCIVPVASGCEPGLADGAPELRGLAVEGPGRVVVTDRAQGLVWRVGTDAVPTVLVAFDDRSPAEGPDGIAVDAAGDLVVSVTGLLSTLPPGQAAIVAIPVDDDGTAGERTTLATFDAAAGLAGVAVGETGSVYAALRGERAVVAVRRDGTAQRFDGAGFQAPVALALRDGELLVTDQPVDGAPAPGAVHAVPVDDRPIARRRRGAHRGGPWWPSSTCR